MRIEGLICRVGYTHDEKLHIARRFLLPKQLESSGMDAERVDVTEAALARVIQAYTREAGVRSLERAIGAPYNTPFFPIACP